VMLRPPEDVDVPEVDGELFDVRSREQAIAAQRATTKRG
jgi:hypothetical protein